MFEGVLDETYDEGAEEGKSASQFDAGFCGS